MVGIVFHNEVKQADWNYFRRKDQVSGEVIWSVFEKVAQSSSI
jgi:hypothetical protein